MTISSVRNNCLTALLLGATAFGVAVANASVYTVGELAPVAGDDIFSASWLHDASGAQIVGDQPSDNGAYRSGKTSGGIAGSLFGDLADGKLTGIGGTLTGNLSHLLKKIDVNLKNQAFTLKLGESIDSSHTGALKFETNGAGTGEFTGGFIDYLLEVPGVPSFSLAGTFFFKPQAETGSTALSPNRGDASAFTLWGYNWMHDSAPVAGDPPAADWLSFLGSLGYEGTSEITRPEILDGGQSLGIALFASSQQPVQAGHAPEPTALLVWGGLAMLALGAVRATRQSG